MAPTHTQRDRLDEVLAELERARQEPEWVPPEPARPRRLIRAPESFETARWAPSRTAVIAMILVALCAAAILGVRVLLMRDSGSSAAPASASASASATAAKSVRSSGASASASASTVAVSSSSATTPSPPSSLHVHVVGAVVRPGVVTVRAGARVSDAVAAAGGMTRSADPAGVNLARTVNDGEQIYIAKPGETHTPAPDASAPGVPTSPGASASSAAGSGSATASAGGSGAESSGGIVNLNTADLAALDSLPGVGPVLAQRILDWRTEHGKFSSVDELDEVSGIGEKAMERLRSKVTV